MTVTDLPLVDADLLKLQLARWRAVVEADLKGAPFEKKLITKTPEGVALKPLYSRADLSVLSDLSSAPGDAPFLRGMRPLGYRLRPWEVAQSIPAVGVDEFNRLLLPALMTGQNAVVLTPDKAGRCGLDPDEAVATAVGESGVSVADVQDLACALAGVDLTAVPVHLHAGADPVPLAALYLEHARRGQVRWADLTGSVTADPIAEWVSNGCLPAPLDRLFESMAIWTGWAGTHEPRVQTIGVNAAPWYEAGGTSVHELAFALATAAEYVAVMSDRGMSVESTVAQMAFSFAMGPQFFSEIAKLRAFRALWTRVVVAFGAAPEAAAKATVGAVTGSWNKTLLDPHVNLLRVTTEAMSAVLGGCDRLHVTAYDEVAGRTSDISRRIARNVHVLLAEEFGLAETADPAGGSWYLETLTDQTARAAWTLFQDIERRGGMCAALRAGVPQELVSNAAKEKREGIKSRRIPLLGTNVFPNLREKPLARSPVDDVKRQRSLGDAIRARRGQEPKMPATARDATSRFDAVLAAARAGGTIGQLSRMIRGPHVECDHITPLTAWRAAEDFEALRARSDGITAKTGRRPRVFLAKMGPLAQHKARADFAGSFFAVGGIEVQGTRSYATPEEAADAACGAEASVVCLCSTDETYPVLVPAFAKAVRTLKPETIIVLAGRPANVELVNSYTAAGIDEFIHLRTDVPAVLNELLRRWEGHQ
ncbi:MAG: methylmalonyl-CoA mutase family protein [Opitutus sp.]